jgi:hypothetical protein
LFELGQRQFAQKNWSAMFILNWMFVTLFL